MVLHGGIKSLYRDIAQTLLHNHMHNLLRRVRGIEINHQHIIRTDQDYHSYSSRFWAMPPRPQLSADRRRVRISAAFGRCSVFSFQEAELVP